MDETGRELKEHTEKTARSAGFQRAWLPRMAHNKYMHAGSLRTEPFFPYVP